MEETLPHAGQGVLDPSLGPGESQAGRSHRSGELGGHTHTQEIRGQIISGDVSGVVRVYCPLGAGPTQHTSLLFGFKGKAVCLAITFLAASGHSALSSI